MAFTERLTMPQSGDPNYTRTAYGGYNSQIDGSPQPWPGSVLANCTGYVHGRWIEIAGHTADDFGLSNGNANTYWGHTDRYTRSQSPALGAIACYGGTYGHVAIVERVNADGSILVSQSNYGGTVFETLTLRPPNYAQYGVTFQGFILNPYVVVEPDYTLTVINGTPQSVTNKAGYRFVITANEKPGYEFYRWTVSGAGSVDYPNQKYTTATIGRGNGTITATYRKLQKRNNCIYYISPLILRKKGRYS